MTRKKNLLRKEEQRPFLNNVVAKDVIKAQKAAAVLWKKSNTADVGENSREKCENRILLAKTASKCETGGIVFLLFMAKDFLV